MSADSAEELTTIHEVPVRLRYKLMHFALSIPDKDFRKAISEQAKQGWTCAGAITSIDTRSLYAIFEKVETP